MDPTLFLVVMTSGSTNDRPLSLLDLDHRWTLLAQLGSEPKMSGAGPRENVFPTRMNLGATKSRMKAAVVGHSLLKKKVRLSRSSDLLSYAVTDLFSITQADALNKRFRVILAKIIEVSETSG